jgi:large subunit ribosomal protein L18
MINKNPKIRRAKRVRAKLSLNLGIPRLTVFRSNKHIWAQVIDDKHGKTLAAASTKNLKENKDNKTKQANDVGKLIAKASLAKKITLVKFDRGLYHYHGRVKALAEGARSGGLKF